MKEVVTCSGARHIGESIARKLKARHSELETRKFPDGELYIRFNRDLNKKKILLVQSFYGEINDKIIEVLLAGYTAKELGAKKVELLALYFPYFRQDKRFKKGEAISIEVMSKLFKIFNKIYFLDPHLHRIKKVKDVFSNGKKVSAIPIVSSYLKKLNLKAPVFIGPDIESHQWVKEASRELGKVFVFEKQRKGDKDVEIKKSSELKKEDVEGKEIVIIDDIISTGNTMLETIKNLKRLKPKKIICVGIHGIFINDSLNELKKYAKIISTNTIPSKASKIDISDIAKHVSK